jgi:hypothetical protein
VKIFLGVKEDEANDAQKDNNQIANKNSKLKSISIRNAKTKIKTHA